MPKPTRAQRNIMWIEKYCVVPDGPQHGMPVMLSREEREVLRQVYDDSFDNIKPIGNRLAAFVALLHTCGFEAKIGSDRPPIETDAFSVWRSASPKLREVLKRDGERITCPELGTAYVAA
jgi:hypothetical protein